MFKNCDGDLNVLSSFFLLLLCHYYKMLESSFQVVFVPVENFKGKNTLSKVSSLIKGRLSEMFFSFSLFCQIIILLHEKQGLWLNEGEKISLCGRIPSNF